MWIAWNEHGDQATGDSFVLFIEARCASKKLKPVPSIGRGVPTGWATSWATSVFSVSSVLKNSLVPPNGRLGIGFQQYCYGGQ